MRTRRAMLTGLLLVTLSLFAVMITIGNSALGLFPNRTLAAPETTSFMIQTEADLSRLPAGLADQALLVLQNSGMRSAASSLGGVSMPAAANAERGVAPVDLRAPFAPVGLSFYPNHNTAAYGAMVLRQSRQSSLETRLTASDARAQDQFGLSVALNGNTALIGAPFADNGGTDAGAAYVFVQNGTGWTQQARLVAIDAAADDVFGTVVALDGNTALIGAPFKGQAAGAVYVFQRSGTTWSQQAKLTAADLADGQFGSAVALSGDTALIGAPFDSEAGFLSGAAYVFERSGTTWSQQAKLLASDAAPVDTFGLAVALEGNLALVGAPFDNDVGAMYVFERSGASWSQQDKLVAGDADVNAQFGNAVALNKGTALIGAAYDNENGLQSGAAYVFVQAGKGWSQQAKLTVNDADAFDQFGFSVALRDNTALVGKPFSDGDLIDAGAAYTFERSGTEWRQQSRFTASDAASNDRFGYSVALGEAGFLVGSPFSDRIALANAGAAYVFQAQAALPGKITIVKDADVESDQAFAFTSNIPGGETFSLVDDGKGTRNRISFSSPAGTYSISETVPKDWKLARATCDNGNAANAVTLGAGDTVTCTFVNQKQDPTAVTLIAFTARVDSAGQVVLAWETGTELNNAGFNLYRATAPEGPWTKLNAALISAKGDEISGASYRYVDTPGIGGVYYQLEDLDYNGVSTRHDPVQIQVGAVLAAEPQQRLYLPLLVRK